MSGAETNDDVLPERIGGRYVAYRKIGSGGMATVYLGRDTLAEEPPRAVAIKRMHPWLFKEPELVASLLDEGRMVSRIAHPNVVSLREVVVEERELFLVLEYVHGEPLSALLASLRSHDARVPAPVALALARDLLRGLHAAHEAKDERERPLGIVHRDVSPHNILVGVDGRAHLVDFGVAKAAGRLQSTRNGTIKGKLSYMAPEQMRAGLATRRSDIYAASIVLWELLTGRRLFGPDPVEVVRKMSQPIPPPSEVEPSSPSALDAIVLCGLASIPNDRYAAAAEMADAIETAAGCAPPDAISSWLREVASPGLQARARELAAIEAAPPSGARPRDDDMRG